MWENHSVHCIRLQTHALHKPIYVRAWRAVRWRHRFAWLNVITFCVFVLIISFCLFWALPNHLCVSVRNESVQRAHIPQTHWLVVSNVAACGITEFWIDSIYLVAAAIFKLDVISAVARVHFILFTVHSICSIGRSFTAVAKKKHLSTIAAVVIPQTELRAMKSNANKCAVRLRFDFITSI